MRHITQEGLGLIKCFEGFSPTIYIYLNWSRHPV